MVSKNLVAPPFVIVGGQLGDKAILLFSNTLYNIDINKQWDTVERRGSITEYPVHRSTKLNAEMSEYTQIVGEDFPQAWTNLFDHLRSPETPEHLRDLEYGVKMGTVNFSRQGRPAWVAQGSNGGFYAFGKMSP